MPVAIFKRYWFGIVIAAIVIALVGVLFLKDYGKLAISFSIERVIVDKLGRETGSGIKRIEKIRVQDRDIFIYLYNDIIQDKQTAAKSLMLNCKKVLKEMQLRNDFNTVTVEQSFANKTADGRIIPLSMGLSITISKENLDKIDFSEAGMKKNDLINFALCAYPPEYDIFYGNQEWERVDP
ncbi:MAG: hypothetical protein N3B21_18500 [Clostridia bacterium]|nr:hypothetical protein [Clostridia bacterium]